MAASTTGLRPRSLPLLSLAALLILLSACAQTAVATPRPVVVEIAGATSMRLVLEELASEFSQRHPNVNIVLRGGGSALGEQRVRDGRTALAASTLMEREPAQEQSPESSPAGASRPAATDIPLLRAPIGIDAVAIVVHEDNPVAALTSLQIQEIFNGRILDWSELGGSQGEIMLISREDGSGTREVFESRVMNDKPVSLTAVVMPTSHDVVEYVSANPYAIGYVSSAYVLGPEQDELADANSTATPPPADAPAVRVLSIDGVLPSDESVRDQSYPLIQPLYLVTTDNPQGWKRQFIDFALSPAGQAIVDRYHTPVR